MIRPAELRKDWPWVKPLLEEVKAKGEHGWLPEDIYAAVSANRAAMYVSDEPEGVIVVQLSPDSWTGEQSLFVWAAHCKHGYDLISEETYALLDKLKAQYGCRSIQMEGRPGWQKRGWKIKKILYER